MNIWNVDWAKVFLPDTPLLEIFIRGTVVYLSLFILLRLILKREAGTVGITDLLVVVLLADAAQSAMAGQYTSVSDGILLVVTIILWSYFLDFLGFRFPKIQRLIHPAPLLLVKDGRLIKNNLRKEFITEDELMSMLREEGVSDVADVREAFMEGDGKISALTHQEGQAKTPPRRGT